MANLHVQPKRKNYAWLWILILILIIAGVAYYFMVYKKQIPPPGTAFQQYPSLQWRAAPQQQAGVTGILS